MSEFVRVNGCGDEQRFVRIVSENTWVSVLYRRTGFGFSEWETAICTQEPRTCNIVLGDRREELADLNEDELMAWYDAHKSETNSFDSIMRELKKTCTD